MIKIYIESGIFIYNLPCEIKERIKTDLTIPNKQYLDAIRNDRYISPDMEPEFKYFVEDTAEDCIYAPRGYIYPLLKFIRYKGLKYKLINETLTKKPLKLKFIGEPRKYQKEAIIDIDRYPIGVLEAATGAGKTFMGTAMIVRRQQPTLIIVHTKELLYQWKESIKKFIGYDAGLIGDGKFEVKKITVGIINTVRNKTDELEKKFGHIIVDEVHRCPSTMWTDTLSSFKAKYVLGLSATPFRRDGLGKAIYIFIGPKVHKVKKSDLHKTGAVLKPFVFKMNSRFVCKDDIPYATKVRKLVENQVRNIFICKTIRQDLKEFNSPILIVSDRVTHCYELQKILKSNKIKSEVLSGKTKKKERTEIVNRVKKNEVKVLFATISLIGEGFDAPGLHALILATPIKFEGRVIQVCGRVLRPEKGKEPRIYDFRDNLVESFRFQGYARDRIYNKEGWFV